MRTRMTMCALAVLLGTTATAAAADAPTLASSAGIIQYGTEVRLHGSAPSQAGETVQLLATGCGFTSAVPIGTATVDEAGDYSFSLEPALGMTVVAQIADASSAPISIEVQPLVQLRRLGVRLFAVDVSVGAGQFFDSLATLERWDVAHKRWRAVASGALKQNSAVGAMMAVSTATIRAAVRKGTWLRAFVGKAALGACYVPASSASLTA